MYQFLLVICGRPASGKTKLANRLASELISSIELEIVSTDDWRDEIYYAEFNPENEKGAREKALRKTEMLVSIGKSVIHDDTNYYTSMRHELYDIAKMNEIAFGIIYVSTPVDVCLQWNFDRQVEIPSDVIRRIDERFDIPGIKYAWDKEMISVNLSTISIEKAVTEILEKVTELRPVDLEKTEAHETKADLRDRMTRIVVSEFLSENKSHRSDERVHLIRKEILRRANELDLAVKVTINELWRELAKISRRAS